MALQAGGAVAVAAYLPEAIRWRDVLRWRVVSSLAPLISRLRKERLLDHPVRRLIYSKICEHDGIYYRELLRRLRISNGTLWFHLTHLEHAGFLRSVNVHGRRRLYATNRVVNPEGFLVTVRQREMLTFIRRSPGFSQREIASGLGLSRSSASYNLRVLQVLGVVVTKREGRVSRYFPSDRVRPDSLSPGSV